MVTQLKLFFAVLVSLAIVDFLWIGLIAQKFYVQQFGPVGRITADGKFDVVLWAAIAVYVILAFGITVFVLPKVLAGDSWSLAFIWGALYGLTVYGIYDMTNHATLNHWPLTLAFVDMAWGTFLGGIIAVIGKYLRDSWLA
ncbi:MAG: DUF2177 family protein [Bacteriovoracia bacterium]